MKEKIKYSNGPINKVEIIPDFLPSPEDLALKEETVKVTISLSKASIDFFKKDKKQDSERRRFSFSGNSACSSKRLQALQRLRFPAWKCKENAETSSADTACKTAGEYRTGPFGIQMP